MFPKSASQMSLEWVSGCFRNRRLDKSKYARSQKGDKMENITKYELTIVLESIKALIDTDNIGKAKEIIEKVLKQIEGEKK